MTLAEHQPTGIQTLDQALQHIVSLDKIWLQTTDFSSLLSTCQHLIEKNQDNPLSASLALVLYSKFARNFFPKDASLDSDNFSGQITPEQKAQIMTLAAPYFARPAYLDCLTIENTVYEYFFTSAPSHAPFEKIVLFYKSEADKYIIGTFFEELSFRTYQALQNAATLPHPKNHPQTGDELCHIQFVSRLANPTGQQYQLWLTTANMKHHEGYLD